MISLEIVARGDRARADLDQVREKVETAKAEIDTISDAPLPVGEALERAMRDIRARSEIAENRFIGYAFVDGGFVPACALRTGIDVAAVLFNIAPRIVEQGLREHLAPMCRDGIGATERATRVAKLKAQLASLSARDEELTIRFLLDGLVVERFVPESPEEIDRMLEVWERTAA